MADLELDAFVIRQIVRSAAGQYLGDVAMALTVQERAEFESLLVRMGIIDPGRDFEMNPVTAAERRRFIARLVRIILTACWEKQIQSYLIQAFHPESRRSEPVCMPEIPDIVGSKNLH